MGRTACTEPQCLYKGDLYLYYLLVHRIPNGGTVVSYANPRFVYLFMILSIISYQQDIDTDEKLRVFQLIRQNIGLRGTQKGKQGSYLGN
jgi:hypothetical protein